MGVQRVTRWKSPRSATYEIYQHPSRLIRWYFYKRLEIALELSQLSADDRVLDLGFGTGFFLPTLAHSAKEVVGIDGGIDSSSLPPDYWEDPSYATWGLHQIVKDLLRVELPESSNVLLIKGDASAIPLKDASTDVVFCLSLLEHTEPKGIISEVRRILAARGRVIFGLPVEFSFPLLGRTLAGWLSGVSRDSYHWSEVIQSILRNAPPASGSRTLTTHRGYDYREDLALVSEALKLEAVRPVPFPPIIFAPYVIARASK